MPLRSGAFLQGKFSQRLPLGFLRWGKASKSRGARERGGKCKHSKERAGTAGRLDFFVNLHFLVQDVSSEATGHLERMDEKEYAHVN